MSRRRMCVAAVALASGLLASSVDVEARQPGRLVLYSAPVISAVSDPFRPPEHIGGPGNRGLEYASVDGDVVAAAADGTVAFVGRVGGRLVVTLEHADGLRTTYTGLARTWVEPGQPVSRLSAIGVAAGPLHLGALAGAHYVDPQILIDASRARGPARLVPPPAFRGSGSG